MTIDELRAAEARLGWTTGRTAAELGISHRMLTTAYAGGQLPADDARFLAALATITERDGVVTLVKRAAPRRRGGWPKGKPRPARPAPVETPADV